MGRWGRGYGDWGYFPPSRPIKAKGGIKAQSKKGEFGESWWAKRWNAVLESFHIGERLNRGRRYARQGQVLSIEVKKGLVVASVQGSRPKPYEVAIQVKPLSDADWRNLAKALSQQAIHVAKLLAGEMPQDIEDVFKLVNLSLFPTQLGDLATKCSCPDYSNPCKHIAAVYYLLGEEFDRDPFLLFRLRGRDRDEFLALLSGTEPIAAVARPAPVAPKLPPEPLPTSPAAFWKAAELPADFFGDAAAPPVNAALPRRLGPFPFWRGQELFLDAISPTYANASPRGVELVAGPTTPTNEPATGA